MDRAWQGTQYVWNAVSPRVGITIKLGNAGRTMLRSSYGRFRQGGLTGELSPIHSGGTVPTTFDLTKGTATTPLPVALDHQTREPYTDEYSVGVDREIGRNLALTAAYVRKDGHRLIGWTDDAGSYHDAEVVVDGRTVPLHVLNQGSTPHFLLTNIPEYSLTYNGLVMVVEKRPSHGWQAFASYTYSRAVGLQPSSGTTADGAQVGTVGAPPGAFSAPVTFGRDPNDLTNAFGPLPNDRPQMLRMMTSVSLPKFGLVVAGNLQYVSGKPWAATALINPNPGNSQRRVLIEPRGAQRLPSQTILDLRVSRALRTSRLGRVDLVLDVLNVLNDSAFEAIKTDVWGASTFGQGSVFMDPRRAMLSVKFNLGR